jgi:Acetylglutamate kinase
MKPKITNCIDAINGGVKEATILDGRIPHSVILELFTEHGIGTQIYSKK